MDNKAIRKENLRLLLDECGGNQSDLARRCGSQAAYINQVLHGWKGKGIGDSLARRLEKGMNKEAGWMDRRHLQVAEPGGDYQPDIGVTAVSIARRIQGLSPDAQRLVTDFVSMLEQATADNGKRRARK